MIDSNTIVRTLGLYQPFAGLMMNGKTIETRWIRQHTVAPFPPGEYLIYATKKAYKARETSVIAGHQYDRIIDIKQECKAQYRNDFELTGHALCLVTVTKRIWILPNDAGMERETFVKYTGPTHLEDKNGKVHTYALAGLVCENVRKIEPFPFKGKQGVGILSDADKSKIKFI